MPRFARFLGVITAAAAVLAAPVTANAAGPLLVNSAGTPYRWAVRPVPFNPDRGPLGARTNAQATADVESNFAVWDAVTTADVSFANAEATPADVDATCPGASCWSNFVGRCGDALSPIVFDADGSITDDVFGAGANNSILGFAGPDCGNGSTATITEGSAVLNGRWIDGINTSGNRELSLTSFNAVFIHEFGHYVGLDHSQVNLEEAFDGNSANDDAIATMFPILINGAQESSLNLDDRVSLSSLYPAASFATGFGAVTGTIRQSNGATGFQGAYVIARKIGDPRLTAVGAASGARFAGSNGGSTNTALRGLYELPGLPAGSYTIEIEEIDADFTGGSSVGPLGVPADLPGPAEFWNGANEAATNPPDAPAESLAVTIGAGTTTQAVDVVINGPTPAPTPTRTATPTPTVTATPVPNPPPTCGSAPDPGCRLPFVPGKSSVLIRNSSDDRRDLVSWRWLVGAATAKSDFGDPMHGDGFELCIYDGTPSLIASATAPAGGDCAGRPCWTDRPSGFQYTDKELSPDGIQKIQLRQGADGRAKILVKAVGVALDTPAPPLASSPVTVELKSSSGVCWQAVYSFPLATKNVEGLFKDRSD